MKESCLRPGRLCPSPQWWECVVWGGKRGVGLVNVGHMGLSRRAKVPRYL